MTDQTAVAVAVAAYLCPACVEYERVHPWNEAEKRHEGANLGSRIECAFTPNGAFKSSNWNCASLDRLRARGEEREVWNDDQHAALVPAEGGTYFVVSYYKHRGRTEGLFVLDSSDMRPATLDDVAAWLASKAAEVMTR